jgi:hypothetical protein
MPEHRPANDGEFPVEVIVDSPHKLVVSWDWHDMAGAITPPGARLVITVAQMDPCPGPEVDLSRGSGAS